MGHCLSNNRKKKSTVFRCSNRVFIESWQLSCLKTPPANGKLLDNGVEQRHKPTIATTARSIVFLKVPTHSYKYSSCPNLPHKTPNYINCLFMPLFSSRTWRRHQTTVLLIRKAAKKKSATLSQTWLYGTSNNTYCSNLFVNVLF